MELLQQKQWKAASQALAGFIAEHSTQAELFERARMYLRVCAQHMDEADLRPKGFDERCSLAVLHANRGQFGRALKLLKEALLEQPDSDKAHYLMASTLALKGDRRAALAALKKAIDLDDGNRIHAARDPDFTVLRDDEKFITLTTREDEEF